MPLRRAWPAYTAAVLAFASAGVSLYWTLGGTYLLDTVGGGIEDLALDRAPAAIALGAIVVAVKAAAGLLALALVRPWGATLGRGPLLAVGLAGSALLVLYGAALVVVGALVLADAIVPTAPVDEHALRWHVFVWDLWFLIWGAALGLATVRYRHDEGRARGPGRHVGSRR